MKKSRRDPSINYIDENKMRVRAEQLETIKRIIHEGRHEAEPEYVEAIKTVEAGYLKARVAGTD